MLERDLAGAPGEAVAALYRQLRAGTLDRDDVQAKDLPVAGSPFVGRELEWNQLINTWNTARERGAHLLLVTGELGIGKSRLAQELGRSVRAEGHVVASARALPEDPRRDDLRSPIPAYRRSGWARLH